MGEPPIWFRFSLAARASNPTGTPALAEEILGLALLRVASLQQPAVPQGPQGLIDRHPGLPRRRDDMRVPSRALAGWLPLPRRVEIDKPIGIRDVTAASL